MKVNGLGKKILVLGGTGFVGSRLIQKASSLGYSIVSISRRGKPSDWKDGGGSSEAGRITWLQGDATDNSNVKALAKEHGPYNACVHAIGLLLDSESGLSKLNKFVSGSKSTPSTTSTYNEITKTTAFNAIESMEDQSLGQDPPARSQLTPFVFISAAEAGWTFPAPVNWLERYLIAKRAVESKLLDSKFLRPVIMRPSLIWTWEKPIALLSVVPFYIGNKIGIPIVDRPVLVESLVDAIIASIEDSSVRGVQRYMEIDKLSKQI